MISVIIPTYNRVHYLQEAIESVLRQTYKDFEIIIVDDASTDNTKEIVLSYGDRVRYVCQDNKERAAARNNGIIHAKGGYIAFLDSDDIWLPNHLQVCLHTLNSSQDAGLAFSGSCIIDENGKIISKVKLCSFNGFVLNNIVSKFSSGGCNASSCLIKKEIFNRVGYFNEDRALSGSEDWEIWVRIAASTKFISTNLYTVKLRFHKEKSSINADKMAKSMTKALDTIYNNADILPKIKDLKKQAYSSLYTIIAINYYASGNMEAARKYLKSAVINYPTSIFTNKYLSYTLLRSLLGSKLSFYFRRAKWMFNSKLYNPIK